MAAMEEALTALAHGTAINPLRQMLHLPDKRGLLGMVLGYVEALNSVGLKVVTERVSR